MAFLGSGGGNVDIPIRTPKLYLAGTFQISRYLPFEKPSQVI